jgi:hypothetical protein
VNKRTSAYGKSLYQRRPATPAKKSSAKPAVQWRRSGKLLTVWILIVINVVFIYSFVSNYLFSGRTPRTGGEVAPDALQVRVQNGCGVKGVANVLADFLRNEHYRILVVENADDFSYEKSVIVDHDKVDRDKVEEMASALGVSKEQIYHIDQQGVAADVTFIVGKDYAQLKSYKASRK